MGTIETLLRVKADASAAVRGLLPLQASLEETAADAQITEKALNDLDGQHNIKVNDAAIVRAREEISRLRQEIRSSLAVDINADTKQAQARIAQLQRSIRVLDSERVEIPVKVDTAQAEGRLEALRTSATGISTSMKGIGAAVVGTAVGRFLLDGAKGAAAFETNMRGVNAILGETTQIEVAAWIEDSAAALNLSQEAASELARSLSLAAKRYEDAGGDAAVFLENLEKIAANAAAFSGADPGRVAEALGAAFRGEFDSLEQFGIQLTAARVQAEAMAEGILQAGETMTPAIQAQATYNLILKDSAPLMGAVGDNADTLSGKVSNLKQTMSDLGAELGTTLGPALQGLADLANLIAENLGKAIKNYNDLKGFLEDKPIDEHKTGFTDIAKSTASLAFKSLPELGKAWWSAAKNVTGASDETKDAGEQHKKASENVKLLTQQLEDEAAGARADAAAQEEAAAAVEQHVLSMKHLSERVQNTADAYDELLQNFTATNDAMIAARTGVYNYEAAIDDLAASLKKNGATFSPDTEEGRNNWNALVGFATAASQRVEDTLKNRGADAANKIFEQSRDALHQMLVDAGVESGKAWGLVNQTFKKPLTMKVQLDKADIKRINADLEKLRKKRRKIEDELAAQLASPISADRAERLGADTEKKIRPLQVQINADLKNKDETNEELAGIAAPRGKPRKAQINAHVDQPSLDQANADLDSIVSLERTAIVHVRLAEDLPDPSRLLPSGAPRRLPPSALPASAADDRRRPREPERTPRIQVLIDGEEVASHIRRRGQPAAPAGGRRNP